LIVNTTLKRPDDGTTNARHFLFKISVLQSFIFRRTTMEFINRLLITEPASSSSESYAMDGIAPESSTKCGSIRSGLLAGSSLSGKILTGLLISACLSAVSGCTFTRQALLKTLKAEDASAKSAAASDCTRPDCAAPVVNAAAPPMTAFPTPVPSETPPAATPGPHPMPQSAMHQNAMPQNAMLQSGIPQTAMPQSAMTQPMMQPIMQVPSEYSMQASPQMQVPQQFAHSYPANGVSQPQQVLPAPPITIQPSAVPFGYRVGLVPDPAVLGTLPATSDMSQSGAMLSCPPPSQYPGRIMTPAQSSPVDEKLTECQTQVEALSQRLSSLQDSTQSNELTLQTMAAEQMRLKKDNELLRKRAEMADKQYLQTLDSLSNMLEDDRPEPAEPVEPAAPSTTRQTNSRSSQPQYSEPTSVLLPTVE
jgi:hypothetical protein